MVARGKGGIIFIGSGAGEIGTADVAVYSATKAYLKTLAEALWFELRPSGVDVLYLVLGVTRTPQLGRLGYAIDDPNVPGSYPRDVARAGLARLPHGPAVAALVVNDSDRDDLRPGVPVTLTMPAEALRLLDRGN